MSKSGAPLKLILMRHGEAHQGGVSDHNRSLTHRGSSDSQNIGKKLSALLIRPFTIVCSDATRTKQTSENILQHVKSHPVVFEHDLYTVTSSDKFARCVAQHVSPQDSCVMVIGHNPSISLFASVLTGQPISFGTADCHILKSDETDWDVALASAGTWEPSSYISPSS